MISALLLLAFQAPTLTDQSSGTDALLIGVHPVSDQVVWASGTRGTVLRTTDGGANWSVFRVPGADSLQFRDVHATSALQAWVLSIGNGADSRIYRTTDGGSSWMLQWTNDEPRAFFDCLAFWDERRGMAISDAVDGRFVLIRTSDGGGHWERVPADQAPEAREGEGLFAASGTCLRTRGTDEIWFAAGAGGGRVGHSTDGGRSWTTVNTPILQSTPSAGLTSLVLFDDGALLGVGGDVAAADSLRDRVVMSTDGGRTWTTGGDLPFRGAAFGADRVGTDGRTAVAVGPGGAALTRDGGRTWVPLDSRNFWSVGFAGRTGWMVGTQGRVVRVEVP